MKICENGEQARLAREQNEDHTRHLPYHTIHDHGGTTRLVYGLRLRYFRFSYHVSVYMRVFSLHMCVLPYKYCKTLEMFLNLMKFYVK